MAYNIVTKDLRTVGTPSFTIVNMADYFVLTGILLPFLGTSVGAAFVLFMRKNMSEKLSTVLMGFTSGVMMAAAIWSLLLPSIEMSAKMGTWSFIPASIGFLAGIGFLLVLDRMIPHLHAKTNQIEGPKTHIKKITMMVLAVTLHNIPEGMAVGVVFSECLSETAVVTVMSAYLLSFGIALQNIPEGAIISMPLKNSGKSRGRAFVYGVLSGAVEPVGAAITILLTKQVENLLSYLLAFAAGAMVYVIVEELVPESSGGENSDMGTIGFAIGFVIMMIMDVAFGS